MSTDEKPDINKQLRNAEEQRERLVEQLKESEAIIDSIETRLTEVTKSQEARLRADDRVDNKLLDQVQSKKNKPESASEDEKEGDDKKKAPASDQSKDEPQQIMTGDSSWYEIIVDEDGNKKERLRN